MANKKEIIVFHWVDACMHGTDQKTRSEWQKARLVEGIVAGHLVAETKEHITVAMDLFYEGQSDFTEDNFRQVAVYPKKGIKKIIKRFLLHDKDK